MYKQKEMFTKPFKLKTGKRKVSRMVDTLTVNGQQFDLDDLYEVLYEIHVGETIVVDARMCQALKKLDIVSRCGARGSRWRARKGYRFDEFYELIEKLMEDEGENQAAFRDQH